MILGLTGGVGSGKSTVTEVLRDEYGFELLHTDDIAKKLELPCGSCYMPIVEAFGEDILQQGLGSPIDNQRLADRIYADPKALARINEIVHPAVWRYVSDYIDSAKQQSGDRLSRLVSEAAAKCAADTGGTYSSGKVAADTHRDSETVRDKTFTSLSMLNNNTEHTGEIRIAVETALPNGTFKTLCDEIWYIYTEREVRIARLVTDRGYTREKSESVVARQMSDEEYKSVADFVIDNSYDIESTKETVRKHLNEILQLGERQQR